MDTNKNKMDMNENTENTITALDRAVSYLDARPYERTRSEVLSWIYYATETRSEWIVPRADMVELGRRLSTPDADDSRVYSEWCADSHHEELFDESEGWGS